MEGATFVEFGAGPPLVLLPGIQGRWEYLQATVDALAASFRVLTFPLCGERDSGAPFDPALGLDNYTRQITSVLDRAGCDEAIICGVSFGGLAAVRFAAVQPTRTAALVLVSVPGPGWHLRPRHHLYARLPWVFGPLFFIETPFRLRGELAATFPSLMARLRFSLGQLATLRHAPLSPVRMAARANLFSDVAPADDCARISAPALVITGERDLDRVVSVPTTVAYTLLLARARHRTIERTGHLGAITRPDVFASLVREFVDSQRADVAPKSGCGGTRELHLQADGHASA